MDTQEKLEAMIGTTGSENLVQIGQQLLTPEQFEEQLSFCGPRVAKKIRAEAKQVVMTWTWEKQLTRHSPFGFCLVHSNEVVKEA